MQIDPGTIRAKVLNREAERRLEVPMKIPVRLLGMVFQID
jgi:hypothetical protein